MIKNITLENFFSFGNRQTIELNAGVNVLVGINGSGKSNFIRALELLHEGVSGKGFEDVFQRKWSGFEGVRNFSKIEKDEIQISFKIDHEDLEQKHQHNFTAYPNSPIFYNISIEKFGKNKYSISEKLIQTNVAALNGDRTLLNINNGVGEMSYTDISYINNTSNKYVINSQTYDENMLNPNELALSQISDPGRLKIITLIKTQLEQISLYANFDTTFNSPIRNLNSYQSETKLRSDGSNLVSLLQKIKNNHTLEFEKIEEAFAQINPHFKSIDFDYLGSKFQLVIREKNLSKTITAEHISDGTLRFMLLLSILYNPERGNLVCLDEPETGLHPDMIRTIAKAIKYAASQGTQVILATHSPLLLNHFEIDDVLIFEKNEHNETVVLTKDEDDFDNWNDSYTTGKLWVDGKLGGVRW